MLAGADVGLVGALAEVDVGQGGEGGVDDGGHGPLVGQDEGRAPGQLGVVDPGQVEGHPAARAGLGQLLVVALDVAHPGPLLAGEDHDLGVEGERAAGHGPGHDRAGALGGEDPVDPQPGPAPVGGQRRRRQHGVESHPQLGEAPARAGVDGQDLGRAERRRRRQPLLDLETGQLQQVVVDQVGLADHRQRHGRCRAGRGSGGAPRSGASTPRWPPPPGSPPPPPPPRPACS